jgi:type I restriction enzyme S subunit
MEVKPGYKQTEVGVVPEEWDVKPLDDVVDFLDGRRRPVKDTDRAKMRGDIPYYGASGVVDYVDAFLFDEDLILLGEDGENILSRNCRLAFKISGKTWVNNHAHVLRPTPAMSLDYLTEFLESRDYAQYNTGTAQPKLNKLVCSGIPVLCPPLPEQRAIAGALRDVDALLGALDQLITKNHDLKQAAMQRLLTGKERLPGFQSEWVVKRLREVIELIPAGIYGAEKQFDGTTPYHVATTAHIDEDDTWNNKEMSVRWFLPDQIRRYSIVEGDLIIVKSSGSAEKIQSGKIGFVDAHVAGRFLFSNFLMLLRPTSILPRFLYFYLCSYNVKKLLPTLVEASTYPNIRIDEYLNLDIPTPKLDEQAAIAEVLSDIDAELAVLEQRRDKTRALKQGMMQELLTGRTRLI